jgi:poly(3-hydroxybutyrate) depolymerase
MISRVVVLLGLVCLQIVTVLAQVCPSTSPSGDYIINLPSLPNDRSFVIHVPPSIASGTPAPVVIALHSASEDWDFMADVSGIATAADSLGFITVFARGVAGNPDAQQLRSWNAGTCCGYASEHEIDDVAYFDALLDWMEANYCIDPLRVHVTGFSNGGEMAWRLACQSSDRIASVAVVAGALTNSLLSGCLVPCPVGDPLHAQCYSSQAAKACQTPNQSPTPLVYPCTHGLRSAPVLVIGGGMDGALPVTGGTQWFLRGFLISHILHQASALSWLRRFPSRHWRCRCSSPRSSQAVWSPRSLGKTPLQPATNTWSGTTHPPVNI